MTCLFPNRGAKKGQDDFQFWVRGPRLARRWMAGKSRAVLYRWHSKISPRPTQGSDNFVMNLRPTCMPPSTSNSLARKCSNFASLLGRIQLNFSATVLKRSATILAPCLFKAQSFCFRRHMGDMESIRCNLLIANRSDVEVPSVTDE